VSFSPDGTKIASGCRDKMVKLWDVTSGECLQTLRGHSDTVISVSFSPDGTKVASGSSDDTVKLWDVTSGECLQTLKGHFSDVESVSFSPDGTKVASASWDDTVKLWDVDPRSERCGECLQTLGGHSDEVNIMSFSTNATFKIAYKSLDTKKVAIRTYVFTWVIDARNYLLAFAYRNFSGDPLPFVRHMYPHFFDHTTERYLLYNDETNEVELKTDTEVLTWFEKKRIELTQENLDRRTFKDDEAVNENILFKLTRLKF